MHALIRITAISVGFDSFLTILGAWGTTRALCAFCDDGCYASFPPPPPPIRNERMHMVHTYTRCKPSELDAANWIHRALVRFPYSNICAHPHGRRRNEFLENKSSTYYPLIMLKICPEHQRGGYSKSASRYVCCSVLNLMRTGRGFSIHRFPGAPRGAESPERELDLVKRCK